MEENSAVYGEKMRMMYNLATAAPYGFFYVKMTATKPVDMFWKGFGAKKDSEGCVVLGFFVEF